MKKNACVCTAFMIHACNKDIVKDGWWKGEGLGVVTKFMHLRVLYIKFTNS